MKYNGIQRIDFTINKEQLALSKHFTGIALPFNTIIEHWIFRIAFSKDAVINYYSEPTPLLLDHNTGTIIGNATFAKSGNKLVANLKIDDEETLFNLNAGNLSGLSVGVSINAYETLKDETGTEYDLFKDITINELSVVAVPAFQSARVENVLQKSGETLTLKYTPPETNNEEETEAVEDHQFPNLINQFAEAVEVGNYAKVNKMTEEVKSRALNLAQQIEEKLKIIENQQKEKEELTKQIAAIKLKNNVKILNTENKENSMKYKLKKFTEEALKTGISEMKFAAPVFTADSPNAVDIWQGELPVRRPFIMDFLPVRAVENRLQRIHRLDYTKAADVVAEGAAKPTATATFKEVDYLLKKIAVNISVSQELLLNPEQLVRKIETKLLKDLYNRIDRFFLLTEDYGVVGKLGILNSVDNSQTNLDLISAAAGKNWLTNNDYTPDAIGINAAAIAAMVDAAGNYSPDIYTKYFENGTIGGQIIGLPIVEAPVLANIGTTAAEPPAIIADRTAFGEFLTFSDITLTSFFDVVEDPITAGKYVSQAKLNLITLQIEGFFGVAIEDINAATVIGNLTNIAPHVGPIPPKKP